MKGHAMTLSGYDRLKRLQRRCCGLALDVHRLLEQSEKVNETLVMAVSYLRDELTAALEQVARAEESDE
jgi:hypothetical protein